MKKKFICLAVAMLLAVSVYSGEMKYYSDWETGYKGYAGIQYADNLITELGSSSAFYSFDIEGFLQRVARMATEEKQQLGFEKVRDIEKLSKEENFLIWSALNEYELSDGDAYSVGCDEVLSDFEVKYFIVVIINNGKSFKWVGAEYTMSKAVKRYLEGK